jgi:hypothetical protein
MIFGGRRLPKQIFEQCPIVDHRLAQIFGRGFARGIPAGQIVRRSIVTHDIRVVDGDVRGALLKIAHGIPPRFHHFANELVCFRNGIPRRIDELRLDSAPRTRKPVDLSAIQFPQVQFPDSLLPFRELLLGLSLVPPILHEPVIFRTKLVSQSSRTLSLDVHENGECDSHGNRRDQDYI